MRAAGFDGCVAVEEWRPEGLFPCIEVALELFGPKRVMIGSIWPVCTMAGRFEAVIGAYLDGIRALSPADRAEILAGTSVRCYRLAP
jgi:L-fuconolactonase